MRLILRQHEDSTETRMQAITQGEIYNPVLTPEWNGGFGPKLRQWL